MREQFQGPRKLGTGWIALDQLHPVNSIHQFDESFTTCNFMRIP
jgi:hypothetical protein